MADTLTVVADTLRTMMGATAADPYIRAIERAVDETGYTLLAEFTTEDEPRPFSIAGRITGTVPSRKDGIVAIRVYGNPQQR